MNLDRVQTLLSRLPVRDRDHPSKMVSFLLNPNQKELIRRIKEQYEETRMIRVVILKSRRVGMSSLTEGILFAHCLSNPNAHAKIVAHLATASEDLFRVPKDLAEGMPFSIGNIQTKRIFFRHAAGVSKLDIATAGTPAAGRGASLSALHLSEAAQFSGEDSFLALLPSVSEGPETIVIVESTANGKEGPGEAFYEFWVAAVEGRSGYIPVFLSYLDDPACVRDPDEADDAPRTELERELMGKPFNATKAQIAWVRRTYEDKCQGLENKFLQEYPHSPDVAFVVTGDPAFPREEKAYVRSTLKNALRRGTLSRDDPARPFRPDRQGILHVWETPRDDSRYYIGADAALGTETGDFASYYVLNGTTGRMVARFADRIHPEALADQLDIVGRWYKNAMVNIELTGNLGRMSQKLLRDVFHYPNLYTWRGKDDRKPGRHKNVVIGWETSSYSRRMLFDTFRIAIRAGMKEESGGLIIHDEALLSQMENATLYEGWTWQVKRGHDDILFAAMLAVVACSQWPPSRTGMMNRKPDDTRVRVEELIPAVPDVAYELQRNWKDCMKESKRSTARTLYHD